MAHNVNDPNDDVNFLVSSAAEDAYPVTKSDSVDLPIAAKGLRANAAGNMVVYTRGGGGANPRTLAFAAGETRYVRVTRVLSTSTTVVGIEALV